MNKYEPGLSILHIVHFVHSVFPVCMFVKNGHVICHMYYVMDHKTILETAVEAHNCFSSPL